VLAPGVGFSALGVLSSRTFGDRTEGGVPNTYLRMNIGVED
jgi:hypothetical protein